MHNRYKFLYTTEERALHRKFYEEDLKDFNVDLDILCQNWYGAQAADWFYIQEHNPIIWDLLSLYRPDCFLDVVERLKAIIKNSSYIFKTYNGLILGFTYYEKVYNFHTYRGHRTGVEYAFKYCPVIPFGRDNKTNKRKVSRKRRSINKILTKKEYEEWLQLQNTI